MLFYQIIPRLVRIRTKTTTIHRLDQAKVKMKLRVKSNFNSNIEIRKMKKLFTFITVSKEYIWILMRPRHWKKRLSKR